MTKNADGANKVIGPCEQCLIPTNNPFWKRPQDEVVHRRSLLQALKTLTITFKKSNALANGFFGRSMPTIDFVIFYCFYYSSIHH